MVGQTEGIVQALRANQHGSVLSRVPIPERIGRRARHPDACRLLEGHVGWQDCCLERQRAPTEQAAKRLAGYHAFGRVASRVEGGVAGGTPIDNSWRMSRRKK